MTTSLKNSLFWKLLASVAAFFLVTSVFFYFYIPSALRTNAIDESVLTAQGIVNQYKTLRAYYTKNVVQKVLAGSKLKPDIDHSTNAEKIPLPATMIHDLSALQTASDIRIKLYSDLPFPNRKDRKLDPFEQRAWTELNKDPEGVISSITEQDGKQVVRVAVADLMVAEACVTCHNSNVNSPKRDWKLGEVRGVLEVSQNIDNAITAGSQLGLKIVGFLVLAMILAGAAMAVMYRLTVQKRLTDLQSALTDLVAGEGDLRRQLPTEGNDEVTRIAKVFNELVGKIRVTLQNVSQSAACVAQSAESMRSSTADTHDQLSILESDNAMVVQSIREMNSAIHEVASSAVNAARQADMADQETAKGESMMQLTKSSVIELSEDTAQASAVISQLEQDGEKIGSIVNVIRSIAEQTNLLALNAAIEAARAGDQGRGFAVVADEVRSLASKTQTSTVEIQEMIARIQTGTQSAVTAMQKGRDKVKITLEKAEEANLSLQAIRESIAQIRQVNNQIATSTEEQSAATGEINKNIENISAVTGKTVEKTQAIQNAGEELAGLARALNELVRQFKV